MPEEINDLSGLSRPAEIRFISLSYPCGVSARVRVLQPSRRQKTPTVSKGGA